MRSDGNNFIPEIAAASVVIKACPAALKLTVRSDSLATLGALSKGAISERKRVRSAGRPWLNFCRKGIINRHDGVNLEHVSSHKGTSTAEQKGNDFADLLANHYRRRNQNKPDIEYFTDSEEIFILVHEGKNIQGDPRGYLKTLEKKVMLSTWRGKPTQGKFVSKFPTQVLTQAKRVWKWSIEAGEGHAWLYYIFGVCQWLPVNHRVHYSSKDDDKVDNGTDRKNDLRKCVLCLTGDVENAEHLTRCPALAAEHEDLALSVIETMKRWKIPSSNWNIIPMTETVIQSWFWRARSFLFEWELNADPLRTISSDRLRLLTSMYWDANHKKPNPSFRCFLSSVRKALFQSKCFCVAAHVCLREHTLKAPSSLLSILVPRLSIQMECYTDPLNRSPLIAKWHSSNNSAMPFGASTSSIEELLPGQNTLIVLSGDVKPPDIRMLSEILTVDKSTRLLALGPVNVLNPLILPASRWYMELARIDSGFPFLTTDFSNEGIVPSASPVSIILCLNRRSLVLDPIDWFGLRNDLIEWADSKNIHIVIPKLTDARFRERLIPSSNTRPGIIKNPAPSVLHFLMEE